MVKKNYCDKTQIMKKQNKGDTIQDVTKHKLWQSNKRNKINIFKTFKLGQNTICYKEKNWDRAQIVTENKLWHNIKYDKTEFVSKHK